ncbi:MAG: EAL domain-containing protein, partial [Micromonosporaceae bacterium]|nr:EAL domain-containing protein [Micromonosporaceae bacterium]
LRYQPILRLRDRSMVGIEALIRWHHPKHGTISPSEFLPVAETIGLIRDIDFGTGHSSLATLHRFPIDALKIDRSFVTRMKADTRSRELVRVMIDMGLNLGIQVLAGLGCPLVQGYLFSRPIPATDIESLFASREGCTSHEGRETFD